jgi:hypothetical protein
MYPHNSFSINSFNEVDTHSFKSQLTEKIKKEIESQSKDYILRIDEQEYINYFIERYTIEPLQIDYNSEYIPEPVKSIEYVRNNVYGGQYQVEIYTFTIYYDFTGSAVIFKVRPEHFRMTSRKITVDEAANKVSFTFKMNQLSAEIFNSTKNDYRDNAFMNLRNANLIVEVWNNSISGIVKSSFNSQKTKFLRENDFFTAISVKVDKNTESIFTTPTIKKKIIPQPTVSKSKEFASVPSMAKGMYEDILTIIYNFGKSMERKPSTYSKKNEEDLRDQFLLLLETRYDSTTASGETFNKEGKTDIILKYAPDGSNLFVAECKFWHGSSEFLKAISQLFEKYLTWRDSKTALILFVKNKEFTSVLRTITSDIKSHSNYISDNGTRGETSFSYIFSLPQDLEKKVFLEVIAFHFD